MISIWGSLCALAAVWTRRRGLLSTDNHYWWDLGWGLWTEAEMPIKWHHSGSSWKVKSDWNQCKDHADRCLRLGWCNLNLYHPPYSPDISQCDCDLIPKITAPLQGIRFRTVHDPSLRNLQRLDTLSGIQRLSYRWGRVLPKICIYIIHSCNN